MEIMDKRVSFSNIPVSGKQKNHLKTHRAL
jgi:hypothetical protein